MPDSRVSWVGFPEASRKRVGLQTSKVASCKGCSVHAFSTVGIMQMSLLRAPRQHARIASSPRRSCCKLSVRAVAATERELAPQQVQKPAPHGRLYNFAAGPAVLPVEVLEEAQEGLLNWKGSGTSVMEMSHRGKEFSSIIQQAEEDLRSLLNIPDNYQVFQHPRMM